MRFLEGIEFAHALKRLSKRYRSLPDDIDTLKEVLAQLPKGNGSKHWVMLIETNGAAVFKTRVACKSLNAHDKIRLVYGYEEAQKSITLIELYFKGEQESETRALYKEYLASVAREEGR